MGRGKLFTVLATIVLSGLVLVPNVPKIYEDVPLIERFLFVPWILLIGAYGLCYYYEKVHDRHLISLGKMTPVKGNYHYTLYWVVVPLILHYYPTIISHISVTGTYPLFGFNIDVKTLLESENHREFLSFLVSAKSAPVSDWVDLLSFPFACFGVFVATQARVYLNGYWGVDLYNYEDDHKKLVTDGPYSKSRHPIYAGQIYLVIATALIAKSYFFIAFAALVCWMNYRRAKKEEGHLEEVFGEEFKQYQKETTFFGKLF